MGIPEKYKALFTENESYHIYNRTNNKEPLFINDRDKVFFLQKLNNYTAPFLDLFSWNLLPNHFHLCVRIKSLSQINKYFSDLYLRDLCITEIKFVTKQATIHELIDNVFKRFFISYSTFFNKVYQRKGNLFHRPFKHINTEKGIQFTKTIIYINTNAVKHRLANKIEDYKWSSYHTIISDKPTKLLRNELFKHFEGKNNFIKSHLKQVEYYQAGMKLR